MSAHAHSFPPSLALPPHTDRSLGHSKSLGMGRSWERRGKGGMAIVMLLTRWVLITFGPDWNHRWYSSSSFQNNESSVKWYSSTANTSFKSGKGFKTVAFSVADERELT
uniref:Uncharacterized protein n=1 Tax=Cacopsylla melanoneura TaxID=428564 RepID=A0A8D8WD49_9HEMI